jgi:hypothetical protein
VRELESIEFETFSHKYIYNNMFSISRKKKIEVILCPFPPLSRIDTDGDTVERCLLAMQCKEYYV